MALFYNIHNNQERYKREYKINNDIVKCNIPYDIYFPNTSRLRKSVLSARFSKSSIELDIAFLEKFVNIKDFELFYGIWGVIS